MLHLYDTESRYKTTVYFEYYNENDNLLNSIEHRDNIMGYTALIDIDFLICIWKPSHDEYLNKQKLEITDFYNYVDYRTHDVALVYLQFKVK